MIHRDRRHGYESASALGQILWRLGPRGTLSIGDLDLYLWRRLPGGEVLRIIEHKQPDQVLKWQQKQLLSLLSSMIGHCVGCPGFGHPLDATSGAYVIRGELTAASGGRRETILGGPQSVFSAQHDRVVLRSQTDLNRWLLSTAAVPFRAVVPA